MRLADVALLSVLGLLAWSQWQEWRLNRADAIDIAYHGVPTVSLWQCAILTQRMTALAEHGGELAFRFRGEALIEVEHHLHKEWQRQGCDRLAEQP
ncbi:hypothetical protein ACK307_08845 [Aeromonas caviae]